MDGQVKSTETLILRVQFFRWFASEEHGVRVHIKPRNWGTELSEAAAVRHSILSKWEMGVNENFYLYI